MDDDKIKLMKDIAKQAEPLILDSNDGWVSIAEPKHGQLVFRNGVLYKVKNPEHQSTQDD